MGVGCGLSFHLVFLSLILSFICGCFHLFKDEKDARDYIINQYYICKEYCTIVKAIVPKGTEYIEGYFDSAYGLFNSIATKAVKYVPLNE